MKKHLKSIEIDDWKKKDTKELLWYIHREIEKEWWHSSSRLYIIVGWLSLNTILGIVAVANLSDKISIGHTEAMILPYIPIVVMVVGFIFCLVGIYSSMENRRKIFPEHFQHGELLIRIDELEKKLSKK